MAAGNHHQDTAFNHHLCCAAPAGLRLAERLRPLLLTLSQSSGGRLRMASPMTCRVSSRNSSSRCTISPVPLYHTQTHSGIAQVCQAAASGC